MRTLASLFAATALLTTACAATPPTPIQVSAEALPVTQRPDQDRDRAAILAMVGEYAVTFDFKETVILQDGYQRKPDKTTPAREIVVLVEDSDERVVLQHLLLASDGKHVVKHWRQDWHYQAPERLEFSEDQTWRLRPLAADKVVGHWTQCVYEVSDAPRYCGTGKWNHRYGVATWTSDRSWRPLPRREYTTRTDYNALNVENRHTVTPGGWTHEQDNTKVVRQGEQTAHTVVREFGFNDYRRVQGEDFSAAYAYWEATQAYWAKVRNEWDTRIAALQGIRLKTEVDGMALIVPVFAQAERARQGEAIGNDEITALFEAWTTGPDDASAAPTVAAR